MEGLLAGSTISLSSPDVGFATVMTVKAAVQQVAAVLDRAVMNGVAQAGRALRMDVDDRGPVVLLSGWRSVVCVRSFVWGV